MHCLHCVNHRNADWRKSNELLSLYPNHRGKDHRVPFGTDHDLGPGQAREGFHPKVPAKTRAHYPQPRTGEWFRTPAAERQSNVHVSAPFGTDTDVPFPQRR